MSDNTSRNLVVNQTNFSETFVLIIIILSLFFYFSDYSFNLDSERLCQKRWSQSEYLVDHTTQNGCLIRINNIWVKEDNIKFNVNTPLKGNK